MANKRRRIASHGYSLRSLGENALQAASNAVENMAAITATAATLSTGWDMVKNKITGAQTKQARGTGMLAHGWHVATMKGIDRQFPKKAQAIVDTEGRKAATAQTGQIAQGDCSSARTLTLLNIWQLSDIQSVTDANSKTYISTGNWKVMWTNLSNIKICYEFYYVTPKADMAATFETDYITAANIEDTAVLGYDRITIKGPEKYPELLKNWRILSKRVFRLGPGETGEIHGSDKRHSFVGDAEQVLGRLYFNGLSTQLLVRYYGAPTAREVVATGALTGATFGDADVNSSFVIESTVNYYKTMINNPMEGIWTSTLLTAPLGGEQIITNVDLDQDTTPAE